MEVLEIDGLFFCLFAGSFLFLFWLFLKDLAQVDFNLCHTADLQVQLEFLTGVDSNCVRFQLYGGAGGEVNPAVKWAEFGSSSQGSCSVLLLSQKAP